MNQMSTRVLFLSAMAVLGMAAVVAAGPKDQKKAEPGKYKRIVLLAFKEGTSGERIAELIQGIRDLGPKIPAIATLDIGPSTGDPKLTQGYTHALLLTFRSSEDQAAFLANETHKRYEKEVLDPHLERALVIEFTSPDVP